MRSLSATRLALDRKQSTAVRKAQSLVSLTLTMYTSCGLAGGAANDHLHG